MWHPARPKQQGQKKAPKNEHHRFGWSERERSSRKGEKKSHADQKTPTPERPKHANFAQGMTSSTRQRQQSVTGRGKEASTVTAAKA